MLLYIASLLAGGLLLWKGADWVVDSASAIARRFGISELIIGLTIVAMGTSLPEFLVTLTATLKGIPSISFANIVGSNIFNLGIILGAVAMINSVSGSKSLITRDIPILLGVELFIRVVASTGQLGRWSGILLTAAFAGYLLWMYRQCKKPTSTDATAFCDATSESEAASFKDYLLLPVGLIAVSFGSQFVVDGASGVARIFGLSEWLIGVTIVAAGTSLPELVTCLSASVKGKNEMILGNLVGSDFFNFAGVLGLTSIIHPIAVKQGELLNMSMAVGVVILLWVLIRTHGKITRNEGMLLFAVGIGRWGMEIWRAAM
ncbi:calcium/sodium antiporter [Halodesulfovibrio marinisediminis]|uniref:Cation:H+ antiporter n=1 Tax=Halodesulfovibrio marinisediminis DSM 17456 TaxID=1121457 RepID=A0A1N6DGY7_9BACT|nr:calcium/sodium antiporter [Halodesulfovibrio marinisediminis]SIN70055.1 cation:H+ antiporter [Halodesulfovibrio marinisediminis DSM 17456]